MQHSSMLSPQGLTHPQVCKAQLKRVSSTQQGIKCLDVRKCVSHCRIVPVSIRCGPLPSASSISSSSSPVSDASRPASYMATRPQPPVRKRECLCERIPVCAQGRVQASPWTQSSAPISAFPGVSSHQRAVEMPDALWDGRRSLQVLSVSQF